MGDKLVGRPRQTTHDEIREVALELFAANGYGPTSLAEVAAAAGISRTTLFSYFPAKRDLLWDDHDEAVTRARVTLEEAPSGHIVDLLVQGMLAVASYGVAEHDRFSRRWRLVHEDDELRAFASLRTEQLFELFIERALARAPHADADLVDSVTRALMAVASHATQLWSEQHDPHSGLDAFTAERLSPLADALRPLLP
ncbi:helix-turn-helix domain-containing protein [Microbacterium pumilum]|uniref:Mycofactocin system transcriptional regulator n=1 Tax=Microbacterium pumilum TaxID=344165 RepID=A0ABP5D1F1_9MICO